MLRGELPSGDANLGRLSLVCIAWYPAVRAAQCREAAVQHRTAETGLALRPLLAGPAAEDIYKVGKIKMRIQWGKEGKCIVPPPHPKEFQ